jgi:hypothetical protein
MIGHSRRRLPSHGIPPDASKSNLPPQVDKRQGGDKGDHPVSPAHSVASDGKLATAEDPHRAHLADAEFEELGPASPAEVSPGFGEIPSPKSTKVVRLYLLF